MDNPSGQRVRCDGSPNSPGTLEKRHGFDIRAVGIIFVADVSLTLLVLKTRQVEQLRAFYQTLGVEIE